MKYLGVLLCAFVLMVTIQPLHHTRSASLFAQAAAKSTAKNSTPAPNPKTVLAKVGKEDITYQILEEAYRKNAGAKGTPFAQLRADSLREFLNLYINYRLKVQDATARGMDKKPDVLADIAQNRASLAMPYLLERALINPSVDTALARRKRELKIGLILSAVKAGEDTARAYKRSLAIIKLIKGGKDFMQVFKDSTEDEYGKRAGGDYGWITSNQLVREIEDVVYRLKVGETHTIPIRTSSTTQPGYFVVKLLESRPRLNVLGRQILFVVKDSADTAAIKRRADSVLKLIRGGADFAALAKELSNDKNSSEFGGLLPAFYNEQMGFLNGQRARLRPEVVKALFALRDREVSDVITSELGFHILRRDSSMAGGDNREELKKFYKQYQLDADKKALVENMKKKQRLTINAKTLSAFAKAVDTTDGFNETQAKRLPETLLPETLFSAGSATFSVGRFRDSLLKSSAVRGYSLTRSGVDAAIEKLSEGLVLESMTNSLEKNYPEFAALMKEFHDGILIFRVEEQEVWSKLKLDTVRARAYHDTIKTRFQTLPKYDFSEIQQKTDSAAQVVVKKLKAGANFDSLAAAITTRPGYAEKKGRWKPTETWETALIDVVEKLKSNEYSTKPFATTDGYSICRLNEVIPARQKTFEEALPDFAAQFQDMVQKELVQRWIESVRAKYPVVVSQLTLDKIWSRNGTK